MTNHLGPTRREVLRQLTCLAGLGFFPAIAVGQQASAPVPTTSIRMAPSRLGTHAIAGRAIVLPLRSADDARVTPGSMPVPGYAPVVRLGAREVPASLVWIAPSGVVRTSSGWMGGVLTWKSSTWTPSTRKQSRLSFDAGAMPQLGFWALVIETTAQDRNERLVVDGLDAPLVWLAEPPPTTGAANAPRPIGSDERRAALSEMLRAIAMDPMQRWRVRLLQDRIAAAELWTDGPAPEAFEDRAIEALAVQHELGWRAAIEYVNQVAPAVATDLVSVLSAVVRMPDGELLPAWVQDESALSQLFRTLIQPTVTRGQKADAARAFLAGVPDAAVWVVDDAGDAQSDITVAFTDLVGRRTNVSARMDDRAFGMPRSVVGHESVLLRTELRRDEAPMPRRNVSVRAGSWSTERAVIASALPVAPPGLTIGPMIAEWMQATWLTDRPLVASAPAAGLLQRAAIGDGWEVFIRCPRASSAGDDVVRVWCGPYASARAVITITAAGEGSIVLNDGEAQAINVSHTSKDNEWSALVRLPSDALEPGGRAIKLGVERRDSAGRRSSWPRPMTPGQIEPGRLLVDLTTWGGLTSSPS